MLRTERFLPLLCALLLSLTIFSEGETATSEQTKKTESITSETRVVPLTAQSAPPREKPAPPGKKGLFQRVGAAFGEVWDSLRETLTGPSKKEPTKAGQVRFKKTKAGSSTEQDLEEEGEEEDEEEVVEDEAEDSDEEDSAEDDTEPDEKTEDESDKQVKDEEEEADSDDEKDHERMDEEDEEKTIATLKEEMRTFESLEEDDGTLLVWGSFNNLYAAQIDLFGQVLVPADKIASSDNRITGIAKPIRWKGDWLIAIRETDLQNKDQIRLIQMDESGEVTSNAVWLKNYERVSLPLFFEQGKNLQAIYFATDANNAGLYFVHSNNAKKAGAGKLTRSFDTKTIYPPIVQGQVYDDGYAVLVHYRSKKPPPMKVLFMDTEGNITRDETIEHEGEMLRLSEPVFDIVNGEVRVAWHESISKTIPPRLITVTISNADTMERRVVEMETLGDLPRHLLKWQGDGRLGGFFARRAHFKGPLDFFKIAINPLKPNSLTKSIITRPISMDADAYQAELLDFDPESKSGIVLANNALKRVFFEEKKNVKEQEVNLEKGKIVENYIRCLNENRKGQECRTKAINRSHEKVQK